MISKNSALRKTLIGIITSMLAPLNSVQVDTFLHKLPQWAELTQESNALADSLEHIVDLRVCREAANAKSDAAVCTLVAAAECS